MKHCAGDGKGLGDIQLMDDNHLQTGLLTNSMNLITDNRFFVSLASSIVKVVIVVKLRGNMQEKNNKLHLQRMKLK